MNKNVLIVLGGGFLVAMLVALMVKASLNNMKSNNAPTKTIQILVAAKDLDVGHVLNEGDLRWQVWPEETVFIGAIIRDGEQKPMEAAQGKLLRSMAEGQPLHMTVFAEEDKGSFLSTKVTEGMRAVGVNVRKHVVADRLIRPGDFVDVLMTYRVRVNTRNNPQAQSLVSRYASETILENVRVLAIDSNDTAAVDEEETGKKKKKKSSSRSVVVTLEVSSEGAEQLVLAAEWGDIHFALRSYGDQNKLSGDQSTTDVHMSKVLTDLADMKGGDGVVRVYSGSNVEVQNPRSARPSVGVDFSAEQGSGRSGGGYEGQENMIIIQPSLFGGEE